MNHFKRLAREVFWTEDKPLERLAELGVKSVLLAVFCRYENDTPEERWPFLGRPESDQRRRQDGKSRVVVYVVAFDVSLEGMPDLDSLPLK